MLCKPQAQSLHGHGFPLKFLWACFSSFFLIFPSHNWGNPGSGPSTPSRSLAEPVNTGCASSSPPGPRGSWSLAGPGATFTLSWLIPQQQGWWSAARARSWTRAGWPLWRFKSIRWSSVICGHSSLASSGRVAMVKVLPSWAGWQEREPVVAQTQLSPKRVEIQSSLCFGFAWLSWVSQLSWQQLSFWNISVADRWSCHMHLARGMWSKQKAPQPPSKSGSLNPKD